MPTSCKFTCPELADAALVCAFALLPVIKDPASGSTAPLSVCPRLARVCGFRVIGVP